MLAQLDRVTGYEPVGQGFESLTAHQQKPFDLFQTVFYFTLINLCNKKFVLWIKTVDRIRPIKENDRRQAAAFQGSLMQSGRIIAAVFYP